MEQWRSSEYGAWLKMSSSRTLFELRRHWVLYASFGNLSQQRKEQLRKDFKAARSDIIESGHSNLSAARSAGPLLGDALNPCSNLFRHFWETGTLHSVGQKLTQANQINPTYAYSLAGEVLQPHYGTLPVQGFHLGSAFASPGTRLSDDFAVVATAKMQFGEWCKSLHTRMKTVGEAGLIIRFHAGDALAYPQALEYIARTGDSQTPVFTGPWQGSQLDLDEHAREGAPVSFDVIDTSNLTDHLGLLNIILCCQPLLKTRQACSSVLYTETLLQLGEDACASFVDRVGADIPLMSIFLGLTPRAFISCFSTQSNVHELLLSAMPSEGDIQQFHERVAWVDPTSGDALSQQTPVAFHVKQLARCLFGVYDHMFSSECVLAALKNLSVGKRIGMMSQDRYHRGTFAAFVKRLQRRVLVAEGGWDSVMDHFMDLVETDRSRLVGMNYQDLCVQLHLQGVHSVPPLLPGWRSLSCVPKVMPSPFHDWTDIPPAVCVVLTVPCRVFDVVHDNIQTPILQMTLTTASRQVNLFSAVHAVPGRLVRPSNGATEFLIEQDAATWSAAEAIVCSCWVPTWNLMQGTSVSLNVKNSPATLSLVSQLGPSLQLFRADVRDTSYIRVLQYRPNLSSEIRKIQAAQSPLSPITAVAPTSAFGESSSAQTDESAGTLSALTVKVDLRDKPAGEALAKNASVSASQLSPCAMGVFVGSHKLVVAFAYPVDGTQSKLRIARKSCYVEVVVPVARPLRTGGYSVNMFPVQVTPHVSPWNLHHTNLDTLPIIDISSSARLWWLNSHISMQMSDRQRALRAGPNTSAKAEDVLLNVKDTIHAIFVQFAGLQVNRSSIFGLADPDDAGIYALLFFDKLRLDDAAFTVVADVAVLPLANELMPQLGDGLSALTAATDVVKVATRGSEIEAWKRLLPTCVERCRTWAHRPSCEYTARGRVPLSVAVGETPLCSCGRGIGLPPGLRKLAGCKLLLPFATRAAISPLFSVSYVERVAGAVSDVAKTTSGSRKPLMGQDRCHNCGGPGKPKLLSCGRCKKVKYCSTACQHKEWKEHKASCKGG